MNDTQLSPREVRAIRWALLDFVYRHDVKDPREGLTRYLDLTRQESSALLDKLGILEERG